MTNEKQIEDVIQTYFDCMYQSSAHKTQSAFHTNAEITGYLEDGLHAMSVNNFASFVESQQHSPKEKGEVIRLDILSIDIADNTAAA